MSENIRQKNKAWSPFFVYGLSRDHDLNINDVHKAFNTGFDEGYNYAVNHQKNDNHKQM